jgi:hypothetical protein
MIIADTASLPTSIPLAVGNSNCAPQDKIDFLQVLHLVSSGGCATTPDIPAAPAQSAAPASEAAACDPSKSIGAGASPVKSGIAEVFAGIRAQQSKTPIASVSSGSKLKKPDAADRTVNLVSKAAKDKAAKTDNVAASTFVPPAPVATPAQPVLLPDTIASNDDAATAISGGPQPSRGLLDITSRFTTPPITSMPAAATTFGASTSREGDGTATQHTIALPNAVPPLPFESAAAPRDDLSPSGRVDDESLEISSTAVVADGHAVPSIAPDTGLRAAPSTVKFKAKPPAASSPERTSSEAEPAIGAHSDTAPLPADGQRLIRPEPPLASQVSSVDTFSVDTFSGNVFAAAQTSAQLTADFGNGHSALRSNHSQSASLTSKTPLAPEKATGADAAVDRAGNTAIGPSISTHATPLQPAPAQPAASSASSPDVAAPASAALPPQGHGSDSAPVHANHKLQSNPIPDPPRMVESGQLRAGNNSSELKISVQLPELGKVEVRAVSARDVITAHLTASSHDALQVIAADRTGLEQTLKSHDVILGSLDSHSQGQSSEQHRQQSFQPLARFSARPTSPTAPISATTEADHIGLLPDHSRISVRA